MVNNCMLANTQHTVDLDLIKRVNNYIITHDIEVVKGERDKLVINEPTGDFFYDPWKLKDIYIDTPLEELYNSLPENKGEARIIEMEPGNCYWSHCDIDNRWHMNLIGNESFLIQLETQDMYRINCDGIWYYMDAGKLHTAANFGDKTRKQLVIRELLTRGKMHNGVPVRLHSTVYNRRFLFDRYVSPWLNMANKQGLLDKFYLGKDHVSFEVSSSLLSSMRKALPKEIISSV